MRIEWHVGATFRFFEASQTLDEIVDELDAAEHPPDWVILRRPEAGALYAFRPRELAAFRWRVVGSGPQPATIALDLHEDDRSIEAPPGQPESTIIPPTEARQPSALRIIQLRSARRVTAIGEMVGWEGQVAGRFEAYIAEAAAIAPDLGPAMGIDDELPATLPTPAPDPSESLDVILSGDAPRKLGVGKKAVIDIRLEIAAGATPLPTALPEVTIASTTDVVATLSVDATKVSIDGPYQLRLSPPAPNAPSLGAFAVSGRVAGATTIDVLFQQGMSDLGALSFPVTITASRPRAVRQAAQTTAQPPAPQDADYLVLLITEFPFGDGLVFAYSVSSDALKLDHAPFQSKPFGRLAGSGGTAAQGYVDGIYTRIESQVLETYDDFAVFDIKLRAISTDMSDQLFDPVFVRAIWEHRDAIHGIKVYSREPSIPWELVRLRHPDTGEVDDRYLCEYGLVRNLGGTMRPRKIGKAAWAYLAGEYPNKTQATLSEDVSYLATTLPGRGIHPAKIDATEKDALLALQAGAFDVLHIACHGQTDPARADDARLIIGDRQTVRHGIQPVAIDALTVQQTANLSARSPLVFLNACQSGREGSSLTRLGGWPAAFWAAGAGAFVGASWSVHEKPATAFARAFYDALLAGATLGAATTTARAAAKTLGDATWLAFLVYGDPGATME